MAEASAAIIVGDYTVECTKANLLGEGGFGQVYKGQKRDSNEEVAIKRVMCRICKGQCTHKDDKYVKRERDALVSLQHSNLVQFLHCETIDGAWYFVTELCRWDLDEQFKQAKVNVSTVQCLEYASHIAQGLRYMHGQSRIHRDLKPANILIKANTAKIGDLGLALSINEKKSDSDMSFTVTGGVGTKFWQAPEMTTDRYSYPVDIYSFALIVRSMLCHTVGKKLVPHTVKGANGVHPLGVWMEITGNFPTLPTPRDKTKAAVLSIIKQMLCLKPEDRMTITTVCEYLESLMKGVPRGVPHIKQRLARVAVRASAMAGVSERGHTVLADDEGRHISLLHGPLCKTAARMERPRGVDSRCRKAVDARGRVLVQDERDADTICLDSKGREIDRSKSSGSLLTCIDDVIVYREKIAGTRNDYRIRLQRGGDGRATYLEPPRRWEYGYLSVCRNNDGAYCVTECLTQSLDFFTAAGDHIRHEDLPYHPIHPNGIAATSSGHVLIAELDTAAIHIHDASGRRVGRFTRQQMQVEEGWRIMGISYCREDDTLTVLAGDWGGTIDSVQTFRIEYK